MQEPPTPPSIRLHAPAKLNLTLEVLGKREDGFHSLRTVMCAIRLCDTLELLPSQEEGAIRLLSVSGPTSGGIPLDKSNLVVRVLEELQEEAGCPQGADVRLHKRIPSQAGLGGGSSDAAAALVAANYGWGLGLATERLAEVGGRLGSDIPFFVHVIASRYAFEQREPLVVIGPTEKEIKKSREKKCVKPQTGLRCPQQRTKRTYSMAVCEGRGERVALHPSVGGVPCLIVKPPFGLPTPLVFQTWGKNDYDPHCSLRASSGCDAGGDAEGLTEALAQGAWQQLQQHMGNCLQAPAVQLEPRLEKLRHLFAQLPVLAHQLSGSGSAYFGLCGSWREAHRAAARLRAQRVGDVFVTTTW